MGSAKIYDDSQFTKSGKYAFNKVHLSLVDAGCCKLNSFSCFLLLYRDARTLVNFNYCLVVIVRKVYNLSSENSIKTNVCTLRYFRVYFKLKNKLMNKYSVKMLPTLSILGTFI